MTLTAVPQAPAPDAAPSESTARMADGTLLRTLRWEAAGAPWASALIVHGLGEHGGRYGTVAAPLAAAGIEVHAYDHRGFGGSAGRRAWVERWSQLHDDLEQRLTAIRAADAGRPLILYGHSLGGLIAAGYVLAPVPRPLPDLLVLSAPAIDDDLPRWKHVIARALGNVVPRMRIPNGRLGDALSHDPAVSVHYEHDPLNVASSTARFGSEASREQARVRAALAAVDAMPMSTYVYQGSDDTIVPLRASRAFDGKANVTVHLHDGLRHETHHEHEHEHVMAEVVEWLLAQWASRGVPGASV
jgi:alpha-beta hydrolase superfamily lysophospholipase